MPIVQAAFLAGIVIGITRFGTVPDAIRQVRARHSQQTVAGTYPPEVIVSALRIGGLLALLAAAELACFTGNEQIIRNVQDKANGYGRPWD